MPIPRGLDIGNVSINGMALSTWPKKHCGLRRWRANVGLGDATWSPARHLHLDTRIEPNSSVHASKQEVLARLGSSENPRGSNLSLHRRRVRGLGPSNALVHTEQRVTETGLASGDPLAEARVLGGNPGLDLTANYPSELETALWGGDRWRAYVGGVG